MKISHLIMILFLLSAAACSGGADLGGVETGNPPEGDPTSSAADPHYNDTQAAQTLINSICEKLVNEGETSTGCFADLTMDQCTQGVMTSSALVDAVGLAGQYATFQEVYDAEHDGQLHAEQTAENDCRVAILALSCDSGPVLAANNPTDIGAILSDPSTTVCAQIFQ